MFVRIKFVSIHHDSEIYLSNFDLSVGLCRRNGAFFSLPPWGRGTVATVDEEIEFRAVQTASTSSVTRDFASQNVSLRERDCHLPHGGRLRRNKFQHTDKHQFIAQTSSSWCTGTDFACTNIDVRPRGLPRSGLPDLKKFIIPQFQVCGKYISVLRSSRGRGFPRF